MKIAVLGQFPESPKRVTGGVEAAVVYVARELAKLESVSLHVITCIEGLPVARTETREGFAVTYLPRRRLGRATWHLREARGIHHHLAELRPDIVHAHGAGLYAGAAVTSSCPAVVTVHGIFSAEAKLALADAQGLGAEGLSTWKTRAAVRARGMLDSAYERWVIRRAEHLITISPYVQQVFGDAIRGKTYLIENSCDERFFDIVREPIPGRVLLPGVVIPRKGVLPLLKAWRAVLERERDAEPSLHLRIAGSLNSRPDYVARCQAYVRDAGIEGSVSFLGQLTQEEILDEYARCALMVLPSFQETAPVTVVEAMASGVPVLATRVGGIPWMIQDGVSGRTIPAPEPPDGDSAALAEALLQALRERDRGLQMARRAKRDAQTRFHAHAVALKTFEVYQHVLGSEG